MIGALQRDTVAAVGLLCLAAAAWWQTESLPDAAAMFPRLAIALLAVLALIYLLRSLLQNWRREESRPFFVHVWRFIAALVLIGIYVTVFPRVGYFTTTLVFIPVFVLAMGMRRLSMIAVTTVTFTASTYVLFVILLRRHLPDDLLIGLLS